MRLDLDGKSFGARPVLGARGWVVGVLPARIAAMVRTMRGGL